MIPETSNQDQTCLLDSLPDDILYLILPMAPDLRYANRRLHSLAEYLDMHNVVQITRHEGPLLEGILQNDVISNYLKQFSYSVHDYSRKHQERKVSGRSILSFLRRDYCFFSPKHVITPSPDTEIDHIEIPQNGSPPSKADLAVGVWKHITGDFHSPSGTCMYAANVHWLNMEFKTRLSPGSYGVHLYIEASSLAKITTISFQLADSLQAFQRFSSFPEENLLLRKSSSLTPFHIYLGEIVVRKSEEINCDSSNPIKFEKWPKVVFHIEEEGLVCQRGLQFQYLYFEQKEHDQSLSEQNQIPSEWVIEKLSEQRDPFLSPSLRAAYEELSRLKNTIEQEPTASRSP